MLQVLVYEIAINLIEADMGSYSHTIQQYKIITTAFCSHVLDDVCGPNPLLPTKGHNLPSQRKLRSSVENDRRQHLR